MLVRSRTILTAALVVTAFALGTTAHALTTITVNKCLSGKLKAEGKAAAGYLQCHSKAAAKGLMTDPTCLGKVEDKILATFTKLDAKGGCAVPGDGPDRNDDADAYAASVDLAVGHAGKCDAAKSKVTGKYVAARANCYAKAANKDGNVDPTCLSKASTKMLDAITKAEGKPPCTNFGQGPTLNADADDHTDEQTCASSPGNPGCSVVACPSAITFSPDGADPATDFDFGWRSFEYSRTHVTGGTLTVGVTGPSGSDCAFAGPIANPSAGAGTIDNQRCTGNTAVHCTNAPGGTGGPCAGLGTCEFYVGPPNPLVIGGVTWCVVDRVAGAVTGTLNVTSGAVSRTLPISRSYFLGTSLDAPCARCAGDGAPNDGVTNGTCNGGVRNGLACDANGSTPGWPDSASTSLDCPLAAVNVFTSTETLVGSTGVTAITLSASSPNCTSGLGGKCACDTCNNVGEEGCATNADCPVSDGHFGICGGRRCMGGADVGLPCRTCFGGSNDTALCSVASQCPGGTCTRPACAGGQLCGRPGEPTKPNGCVDDTSTPANGTICVDTAPVGDHQGECIEGPVIKICSASSGHPQRNCGSDADCCDDAPSCSSDPATPGECQDAPYPCYLDNGVIGNSIVAEGAADPPVAGLASPTIAELHCAQPTGTAFLNVAGLPGPVRQTLVETMELIP